MSKQSPIVTSEELAVSNMLVIQVVIRILERNKLINQDEILEEESLLKKEMEEKIWKFKREN